MNVRKCVYGHDKCRATGKSRVNSFSHINLFITLIILSCVEKYPQAGQNIAFRASTKEYEDDNTAASKMIFKWFSEFQDTDMNVIKKYMSGG